ncbi:hypothetical protein B0J12DRAFT_790890 [Macrophomina phaseolina]|uniref:Uncharacterized protein n=1 Tax=Macrophomina phaseolina TaxID=35725 RepID=A0ABQ8FTC4_9PEZI|nr:hypothetical protein B0J12DRAFT_790890 [Macrophomina phaseolina]
MDKKKTKRARISTLLTTTKQTLQPAPLTPLRHIPGPRYAALTSLPLKLVSLRGRRLHHIHALHLRHGPTARIAPSEVDFASLPAFPPTHRGRRRHRQHDPKVHAARRSLFARAFTKTDLRASWDGVVRAKAECAGGRMREEASGREDGAVNVFKWWTLMMVDVVGQYTQELEGLERSGAVGAFRAELPLLHDSLRASGMPSISRFLRAFVGRPAAGSGKTAIALTHLM